MLKKAVDVLYNMAITVIIISIIIGVISVPFFCDLNYNKTILKQRLIEEKKEKILTDAIIKTKDTFGIVTTKIIENKKIANRIKIENKSQDYMDNFLIQKFARLSDIMDRVIDNQNLIVEFSVLEEKRTNYLIEKTKKPTVKYLESVTVVIKRETITYDIYGFPETISTSLGTGTIVKEDEYYTYILSNKHVAGYAHNRIIYIKDGDSKIRAEHIKEHDYLDLALVRIPSKLSGKRAIKGLGIINKQDKIFLSGHHLGRVYTYGEGVFAGYDERTEEGITYGIAQVPCLFGNSGSGIFDKDGKLVAVIFAVSVSVRGDGAVVDVAHALVIDSGDVIRFLDGLVNY